MKYIFLLLFTVNVSSQIQFGQTQDIQTSVSIDPYASYKEKSLNIDLAIELINYFHYVKASAQHFGALKGNYTDLVLTNGINITYGRFNPIRYYIGVRSGLVFRNNNTYPLVGLEGGLSLPVNKTIALGLRSTYDNRQDMKAYHWPVIWRASGFVTFAIKLK